MLFFPGWFSCFDAFMVSGIHVNRYAQIAEMIVDQRLHFFPVKPGQATGQARQGDAGEFFFLRQRSQCVQGMVHMADRGVSGLAAMIVCGIPREQIDDVTPIGAHPCPQSSGFRVPGLAIVAEVLVKSGHAFSKLQRQPAVKIIIGGDALNDDFCTAQQYVSSQFVYHDDPCPVYFRRCRFAAMRRRSALSLMKPAASFWS